MNSEIETMTSRSVWNIIMTIPTMKNGGMLITNDDKRIEVTTAKLENNRVFYTEEDGKEESIALLSIKEARPLSLDHELPTRRDEAPIDDRDDDRGEQKDMSVEEIKHRLYAWRLVDGLEPPTEEEEKQLLELLKEFKPELCIEFQGNDTLEPRLSSRKDHKSYDMEFGPLVRCNAMGNIPPPSKLVRSQAIDPLPKKRKFEDFDYEEMPPTVVCTPLLEPCENALHDFPRPGFLEPLPVSPRNVRVSESKVEEVEMIPKSEYNKLEDDFARLLKLMFKNNYEVLQDACENRYKVKIRDSSAEQRVYSVMYTFEKNEDSFVVLVNEGGKTLHMSIQEIITVIPSIDKEKPFYEIEPVNISDFDYWKLVRVNILGETVFIHRRTGIVLSNNKEDIYFEAMCNDRNYSSEELTKITEWVKRCGIKVYEKEQPNVPHTPIRKERRSSELRAPRKNPQPVYADKTGIEKDVIVTFLYKGEEKRVLVKVSNDKYLEGICQEDKKYKKYLVEYIEKLECSNEPVITERKSVRAPRKERTNSNNENTPTCARKLDFDTPKKNDKNPSYLDMVVDGIKEMKQRGGCSRYLIKHYIDKKYNKSNDDAIRIALKKGIEEGVLVQNKQSFKLSDKAKKQTNNKASSDYDEYFKKPSVKDALREASYNNKSIFIKYSKGSIPDVKRPIRVIGFQNGENGNDLVVAECLIEDSIRKFKIEHIEIVA
jgi:hypothetical protein